MLSSNLELLRHIHDECAFLCRSTASCTYEIFLNDDILIRAVERSLEIIGEANKKVSAEFQVQYPEISWKKMAAMRNIIIHNYTGVDHFIVWEIIQSDIPELEFQVNRILKENGL